MSIATWPNYHDPATFEAFTAATGVAVEVNVFGSNEEMLAKLQAGGTGWDLFVPTNYTISTYQKLGLIDPLDLSKLPNFSQATQSPRFTSEGRSTATTYALPKNWGTTGMAVNTSKIKTKPVTSWKDFFDVAMTEADGRAMVHDYQLTTIGSALVSLGYSFNSIKPEELAKAEELLIKVKPHLFAINSDYQPSMRATDAWMTMCWTNDGAQLNRDMPEIALHARQGWRRDLDRFLRHPEERCRTSRPAMRCSNYLMTPANAVKEHIANGAPTTDSRVLALLAGRRDIEQDRLSGRSIADEARIRRRRDADRSGTRGTDGAVQVGLRMESPHPACHPPSPRWRGEGLPQDKELFSWPGRQEQSLTQETGRTETNQNMPKLTTDRKRQLVDRCARCAGRPVAVRLSRPAVHRHAGLRFRRARAGGRAIRRRLPLPSSPIFPRARRPSGTR